MTRLGAMTAREADPTAFRLVNNCCIGGEYVVRRRSYWARWGVARVRPTSTWRRWKRRVCPTKPSASRPITTN